MSNGNQKVKVLVIGDISIDTIIVPLPPESNSSNGRGRYPQAENDRCIRYLQCGGAWLLSSIIESAVKFPGPKCLAKVRTYAFPKQNCNAAMANSKEAKNGPEKTPADIISHFDHAYPESLTVLKAYPADSKNSKKRLVYRIERFHGWMQVPPPPPPPGGLPSENPQGSDRTHGNEGQPNATPASQAPASGNQKNLSSVMEKLKEEHNGDRFSSYEPDLLVIHDMGTDFRALDGKSGCKLLQPVADKHKAPWLIWHMHNPLAQGTLWEALKKDKAEKEKKKKEKEAILERTILVVKIECLRRLGVNIADNLSLEREALDFIGSMDANSDLRDLCAARHLVVHFHGEGIWHYDKKSERLIPYYCPAANAKTKLTDPALGMMVGYTTLLTAAIVRGVTWRLKNDDGYDLRLMSVAATDNVVDKGRNLVIVALVGTDLRIRIFDASGARVVDKAENELVSGDTLTALKKRLNPFPDESSLSQEDKGKIIRNATSIAGHTHDEAILAGLRDGIQQGVILDHLYFRNGYADYGFNNDDEYKKNPIVPRPFAVLFDWLNDEDKAIKKHARGSHWEEYQLADLDHIHRDTRSLNHWTRIEGFFENTRHPKAKDDKIRSSEDVAIDIVLRGLKAVVTADDKDTKDQDRTPGTPSMTIQCPYWEFGKIKTADRHEIDTFSSLQTLMSKYIADKQWKTPLSLAVFGPPGTGKSFTIKQILTSVDPRVAEKPLDYNVAQFTEVRDLAQAFHRAQDRALEDEVPLLVFDEFDTDHEGQRLGWLKYFLAPMQDGQFKFGESMYHIGRAIFLFAGGTTETFADFYDKNKERPEFKDAKGPDFVSRLRGHLNIMPINSDGEVNQVLMFRRAVLLRSLLETHCKRCIDESTEEARIDKEVVRAFLHVRSLKHGIRSMEAIIQMAKLSPRQRLQKSSIAPAHQLGMHVDAGEFLGWVNGMA